MFVSLTPYTVYGIGGYSNTQGTSRRNVFKYDREYQRFTMMSRFLRAEHSWGYWTTTKETWTALDNCRAERTYAAVGYGGDEYTPEWSVVYHCHNVTIIPLS